MTLFFLKVLKRFRKLPYSTDDFHIFWENLRKPKCNISLFAWLRVCKFIYSLDYYDNFLVYVLGAKNYLLLLNLCTAYIQPISKILSYFLFQKINTLFQFEGFPQFYYDSVKTVEIVAAISSVAGKVDDRKNFVFLNLMINYLWGIFFKSLLIPSCKDCFHSHAWTCSKY